MLASPCFRISPRDQLEEPSARQSLRGARKSKFYERVVAVKQGGFSTNARGIVQQSPLGRTNECNARFDTLVKGKAELGSKSARQQLTDSIGGMLTYAEDMREELEGATPADKPQCGRRRQEWLAEF